MGSARAVAAYFKMTGGIQSPPIALEGSRVDRAKKVSSRVILIEQREQSGTEEVLRDGVSELVPKTE